MEEANDVDKIQVTFQLKSDNEPVDKAFDDPERRKKEATSIDSLPKSLEDFNYGKIEDREDRESLLRDFQRLSHEKMNRVAMLRAGVLPHLLSFLGKNDDEPGLAYATATIWNLSTETDYQQVICEQSCSVLIEFVEMWAMVTNEPYKSPTGTSGDVSMKLSPARKSSFGMSHARNESCLNTLHALVWLSSNEKNHITILAQGIVLMVSHVLHKITRKSEEMKREPSKSSKKSKRREKRLEAFFLASCRLLHNLGTVENSESPQAIFEADILTPLVHVLEKATDFDEVAEIAVRSLCKLSDCSEGVEPILKSRMVPVMMEVLKKPEGCKGELIEKAVHCIANLSIHCALNAQALEKLQELEVVLVLRNCMKSCTADGLVELLAAIAIANIIGADEPVSERILELCMNLLAHSMQGEHHPNALYVCPPEVPLCALSICSKNSVNAKVLRCPLLLDLLDQLGTADAAHESPRLGPVAAAIALRLEGGMLDTNPLSSSLADDDDAGGLALSSCSSSSSGLGKKKSLFRIANLRIPSSNLIGEVWFYEIVIQCENKQDDDDDWVVHRRFSDFQDLERMTARQRSNMPNFPPVWTLAKTFNQESFLRDRHKSLETWMQALVVRCRTAALANDKLKLRNNLADIFEGWLRVPQLYEPHPLPIRNEYDSF